ncbi:hypothetical protein LGT39_05925 [Demequina sp. TTPB684]|uniref:hypothetical protein n=1 Tax=unclassified Demequina TaxID=2620311 RepID=UPI001CF5FE65|nr:MULTISPECIES: hypothetical protein [unclassified Demequina]MCB2412386.1 hypothetical protein [Demequina sp. TTPB684]UPU89056.1 hypothetical protein LGT36_003780 [Demequina sp. TMPB413]
MSGATVAEYTAAKESGQQASLWDSMREDIDVIFDAVRPLATGSEFTSNDVRDELDRRGVPTKSRAGLFRKVCALHLLEPVMDHIPGVGDVHRSIPSRGKSANGAHVKVYRRTAVPVPDRETWLPPPRGI